MGLLGRIVKRVTERVDSNPLLENGKDLIGEIVIDGGVNLFNAISGEAQKIDLAHLPGSIAIEAGKALTTTKVEGGASIGELSWLIYNQNRLTNKEICDKWQRYDFTETVGGYDSSTYVDKANKQVAITF